jgi:hypothetical protein
MPLNQESVSAPNRHRQQRDRRKLSRRKCTRLNPNVSAVFQLSCAVLDACVDVLKTWKPPIGQRHHVVIDVEESEQMSAQKSRSLVQAFQHHLGIVTGALCVPCS